ncbi:MAG: tetratricopeptide repeat protein [Planctomycetota bacterium]
MQRYRVNYLLLIGLFVGALVIAGAGYGLYVVQSNRTAENQLAAADGAKEAGDLRKEAGYLSLYLQKRPENKEVAARLATVMADIGELPDAAMSDRDRGLAALEAAVAEQPELDGHRRRLIDLLVQRRRAPNALSHVEYLLNKDPKNAELQVIRLTALVQSGKAREAERFGYKLVGYDPAEDAFDAEKAATPDQPPVYQALAELLLKDERDPRLAERLMDQLIEVNPDSSDAHLVRGQYLTAYKEKEDGVAEIEKALELDPQNVDALLVRAQAYIVNAQEDEAPEEADARFAQAFDMLQRAVEADATDARVYRYLARLARQQDDREAAIAYFDQGIEKVDRGQQIQLTFDKARAQLDFADTEGASKTIEKLEEFNVPQEFIDYLSARRMAANQEWYKAAEEFLRLRPTLTKQTDLGVELNIYLGDCCEKLGQLQRARDAYGQVLAASPSNRIAKVKLAQLDARLNPTAGGAGADESVGMLITNELSKPQEEQDWDEVLRRCDAFARKLGLAPGMENLLKAEVFARRGMYKQTQEMIRAAVKDNGDNVNVWRSALRLIASDPSQGPAKAIEKLETLQGKFGDLPILRLDKADFFVQIGDEGVSDQLMALTEGIGDWSPEDQARLYSGLAARFAQLSDQESRQLCLNKVVELSPSSLPAMLDLFRGAIDKNDPEAMDAAQQRIKTLVGSTEKATYLFTEATRMLWAVQRGKQDAASLEEADKLIERALLQRPDWHELHLLEARVAYQRGDKRAAIAAFAEAQRKGPPNALAILQHVGLLLEQQRYFDAAGVLNRLQPAARQRLLGRNYAEVLLNTGDVAGALTSADKAREQAPEDPNTQLWYGRFNLRAVGAGKLPAATAAAARKKAEAALVKAVELAPGSGEAWLARVGFLIADSRPVEAAQALRNAQLALPEDELPAVLARSYAALGRFFDAEQVYKRMRENRPEDMNTARMMAAFYLSPRYPKADKRQKATPLINDILRQGAGDDDLKYDPNVVWARRRAAELLATLRDYPKLIDAEALLNANRVGGELTEDDKVLMARILASRPEPESRVRAIKMLQEVQQRRVLSLADDMRLGDLYFRTENWDACRRQMRETIARNPSSEQARQQYINMLLRRGGQDNVEEASRELEKLQRLGAPSNVTLGLLARVANELGKQREALQALRALIPRDLEKASPRQLLVVANLTTELGDLDLAERLFRAAAAKDPTALLLLADFLGAKRDPAKGFELLDKVVESGSLNAGIRGALVMLQSQRDKVGDKYDAKVEGWLDKALREDPESAPLLQKLAELRDMQQRYSDAADIYRKMLDLGDLEGTDRAVVLNNLAYLLGLGVEDSEAAREAMGYVEEAVTLLGPQANILDTRAVIHTALGEYDEAIADLRLALIDDPTASKHFHLARAYMLSGDSQQAVASWNKALELGLTRESVATAEREGFDELKQEVDRLSQSAAG